MKQQQPSGIVPEQHTGEKIDVIFSVEMPDAATAILQYKTAKQKLLNVNNWHQVAGVLTGSFQLTNASGEPVYRNVALHDYFRIDIPGPGSSAGKGYDWVLVEAFEEVNNENGQHIGFRVRPSPMPAADQNITAHFYSNESTSSFMVTRQNKIVTVSILDRNISPNMDTDSLLDKIRNAPVAISALGLFSKFQWQQLAKGMVESTEAD